MKKSTITLACLILLLSLVSWVSAKAKLSLAIPQTDADHDLFAFACEKLHTPNTHADPHHNGHCHADADRHADQHSNPNANSSLYLCGDDALPRLWHGG